MKNLLLIFSYPVVTGSTDGIGKAYAQELASHGVNIILISRSQDKLRRVAKDIGKQILALCFIFGRPTRHFLLGKGRVIQAHLAVDAAYF